MSTFDNDDLPNSTIEPSNNAMDQKNRQNDRKKPSDLAKLLPDANKTGHNIPTIHKVTPSDKKTNQFTAGVSPNSSTNRSNQQQKSTPAQKPAPETRRTHKPMAATSSHRMSQDEITTKKTQKADANIPNYLVNALLLLCLLICAVFISENSNNINTLQNQSKNTLANSPAVQLDDLATRINNMERKLADIDLAINRAQTSTFDNKNQYIDVNQLQTVHNNIDKLKAEIIKLHDAQKNGAGKNSATAMPPVKRITAGKQLTNQWGISIAAFSSQDNAKHLLNKIKKLGVNAQIYAIKVNNKLLWRVKASGYSSKDAALKDMQRLQTALGLTGLWVTQDKQ